VLPKPGVVLVKLVDSPTVYSIDASNVLHAIPDEATAVALYGADWADYVIDLAPTLFVHFTIGTAMTSSDVVDTSIMKKRETLVP
jgi:hypothetical protein